MAAIPGHHFGYHFLWPVHPGDLFGFLTPAFPRGRIPKPPKPGSLHEMQSRKKSGWATYRWQGRGSTTATVSIAIVCHNYVGQRNRRGRRTRLYAYWGLKPGSTKWITETYRKRFGIGGFFRTSKRTLKKVTLMSRTVRMVHREAEASMIATQLLLGQGALAMPAPKAKADEVPIMCSPRSVLLEIRREIRDLRFHDDSTKRLTQAQRERRKRKTAKQKREWPRRNTHKPPKPPKLLRLTEELKSKIEKHIQAI